MIRLDRSLITKGGEINQGVSPKRSRAISSWFQSIFFKNISSSLSITMLSLVPSLLSLVMLFGAFTSCPDGYVHCAEEGGICFVAGRAMAAYGKYSTYYYRKARHSILCTDDMFGDPMSGVVKECCSAADPAPVAKPSRVPAPTASPSPAPTVNPTLSPTSDPTPGPTEQPTAAPTADPTESADPTTNPRLKMLVPAVVATVLQLAAIGVVLISRRKCCSAVPSPKEKCLEDIVTSTAHAVVDTVSSVDCTCSVEIEV